MTLFSKIDKTAFLDLALTDVVQDETIMITANQRQQRFLSTHFLNKAGGASVSALPTPQIQAFEHWIAETWLVLQDNSYIGSERSLLSSDVERAIWQALTDQRIPVKPATDSQSSSNTLMATPNGINEALQGARIILEHWQLGEFLNDINAFQLPETEYLKHYLSTFTAYLKKEGWLTVEQALEVILGAYKDGTLEGIAQLYIYGFNDLSPLQSEVLRAIGIKQALVSTSVEQKVLIETYKAIGFADEESELRAVTSWARAITEHSPKARIGVIVPNLLSSHAQIKTAFVKAFHPEFYHSQADSFQMDETQFCFDISVGQPLASIAVVSDALDLLSLVQSDIDRDTLIRINNALFWGQGLNTPRLAVQEWLHRQSTYTIPLGQYISFYHYSENKSSENKSSESQDAENIEFTVSDALLKVRDQHRREETCQTYEYWSRYILEILRTLLWPGPRTVNSAEYQALNKFFAVVYDLAQYDVYLNKAPRPSFSQAVSTLKEALQQTPFKLEVPTRSIQILGLMEGAGLGFDYCWVMGLNHNQLPASANPNPLLPYSLQKEHQTPRATPERELHYAQQMLNDYAHSSPEVRLSFSHNVSNEPVHISPLLTPMDAQHITNDTIALSHYEQSIKKGIRFTEFEYTADGKAPEIPIAANIPGGVSHIKLHAINPMLAFLVHRLGAYPRETPCYGFSPADRGTLLHDVLARLWLRLKTQQALLDLTEDEQKACALDNIEHAFQHFMASSRTPKAYSHTLVTLEKQRLYELTTAWLSVEKERPPFVVTLVESAYQLTFLERQLNLRIDRIDTTEQGHVILIDYKTGNCSLSGLSKEPITDPQLPIYTLAFTPASSAVAYAEINRKRIGYLGVGALGDAEAMPAIKAPHTLKTDALPVGWPETLLQWQQNVNHYLEEVVTGVVAYQNRSPQDAVFYQYLSPITRVL